MAESEDGQEKTEDPTPKRLRDAKEKGQIARSRELNTVAVTLVAAVGLWMMGPTIVDDLGRIMEFTFQPTRDQVFDTSALLEFFGRAVWAAFELTLPFLTLMTVIALFAPMSLGGWMFSGQALIPKGERINPLKGIKRIVSVRGLMELGKALAKFLLVASIGYGLFEFLREDILGLAAEPLTSAISHAGEMLALAFIVLSAGLIVVALIDVPFQIWDHTQKLKMTRQEVKDEMKQTEGKPEVKQKMRQMQQEMTQRRMMEDVPGADVVITNPTHYAVALRYDPDAGGAPVLVAKGQDMIALQIRKVADGNGVEIFEAPPLARAIYYHTEIDDEIPSSLYVAVAQVLAYVFQLRAARNAGEPSPDRPRPEVPDDMDEDT